MPKTMYIVVKKMSKHLQNKYTHIFIYFLCISSFSKMDPSLISDIR